MATRERLVEVVRDVATDMAADAEAFDGRPFNGRTVAEYFGNQGAAIAALADVLGEMLAHEAAERKKNSA